jgi:ABC-type multidrug transport system ATPase subunit
MTNLLEIDSVILEFDSKRILQDVFLKCETGTVAGLLGRNGVGKSCLMKILFGELVPNDKSIRINGEPLLNPYRSPRDMRYLPQVKFVPSSLTVRRVFKHFELEFSDFVSRFPEFDKLYGSKFRKLSGGERRIVEIYIVLASKTKFCMLDEPFSHIMPIHIEVIKELITREKENKGIIITDHMYQHIVDISDSVYVISQGKTHPANNMQHIEALGYIKG